MERKVILELYVREADGSKDRHYEYVKLTLTHDIDIIATLEIRLFYSGEDVVAHLRADFEDPIQTVMGIADVLGHVGYHLGNLLRNILEMTRFQVEYENIISMEPFEAEKRLVADATQQVRIFNAVYDVIALIARLQKAFGDIAGLQGPVATVDAVVYL